MRSLAIVLALVVALHAVGCTQPVHDVEVQVVTGLVPGVEFAYVETRVLVPRDSDQTTGFAHSEARAYFGQDFASGHGVARSALPSGDYLLRVRLLKANGLLLVERRLLATISNDAVIRIHITRDCVAVECPSPGGSPAFNTCLAGQCVDPRCSEAAPEFCPDVEFCSDRTDCASTASCAIQSCDEGICIETPLPRVCEANEYCDPAPEAGCTPLVPVHRPEDNVCGLICSLEGLPCQVGFWNCDSGTPVCESLIALPEGTVCGAGTVCDDIGVCVVPTVPGIRITPTTALTTTESGGAQILSVVLDSEPAADVTLSFVSTDVTEGVVDTASLTFAATTWSTPQTVTVSGVDDTDIDGDQAYAIQVAVSSTDPDYDAFVVDDLAFINRDNDMDPADCAGVDCTLVSPTAICVDGMCMLTGCSAPFDDCDDMFATGCETDTSTNPNHCAGCDMMCMLPNAVAGCAASQCTVASCTAPYVNCDLIASNGCETLPGGPCVPPDDPCRRGTWTCTASAGPVCNPVAGAAGLLPAGSSCGSSGTCSAAGVCECASGAPLNSSCGFNMICGPTNRCIWQVRRSVVGPSSTLTGNQACMGARDASGAVIGFTSAVEAVGYHWPECGGPDESFGPGTRCNEWDADFMRCIGGWCGRSDCAGRGYCANAAWGVVHERIGTGTTSFSGNEWTRTGAEGWTLHVRCAF